MRSDTPAHAASTMFRYPARRDWLEPKNIVSFLSVKELSFGYGRSPVVEGLSFELQRGVLVLLGQNGAGKSTTLSMLAGLRRPRQGSIDCGAPWGSLDFRQRVGYLPEKLPLYPGARVLDHLRFAAGLHQLNPVKKAVERVVEECRLQEVRLRRCGQLSKGFQQRVALATAMIHRPSVLLLDEPASGLDPVQQTHLLELIRDYGLESAVVLSTHNLDEAYAVADQVLAMYQGQTHFYGLASQVDRTQLLELISSPKC